MSQEYKEDWVGDDLNQAMGLGGLLGLALNALKTDFAGAVEPTVGVESYSKWLDTSDLNAIEFKIRNKTDDGWAVLWVWDGTTNSPISQSADDAANLAIVFGAF